MATKSTREVMIKTSGSKSSTKKSSATSTSYRGNVDNSSPFSGANIGTIRPTTCWTTEPVDYINNKYMNELNRNAHTYSNKDRNDMNMVSTVPYLQKDRVRLVGGKLTQMPYRHSTTYTTTENRIPIQHSRVPVHEDPIVPTTANVTTVYPNRRPRDAVSHTGAVLHFIT
jgi:hypothetical protein